ncbi:hypothetical protein ACFWNK_02865 [Streptomyces sp. NPDC058417]|uniref:hypothetical protein n=1 Tax=unclassified Streptomyces TaxID=2593676 RepID=UPI00366318B5
MRERGARGVRTQGTMSGLSAEKLGELARRAVGVEGEPRRGRQTYRAARGRRALAAPSGGRGRLR